MPDIYTSLEELVRGEAAADYRVLVRDRQSRVTIVAPHGGRIEPALGKWTFPGGFVEWGESVGEAAVRETREETGLAVNLDGLLGVYSYPRVPVVIVVYRARPNGGTLRANHEVQELAWVQPEAIPWEELAFPSTREALRDWLSSR